MTVLPPAPPPPAGPAPAAFPATDPLAPVAQALAAVGGFTPLFCDGQGHPIENAGACLHLACTLPSPRREEMLGQVASVVRKAKFVLAALVDRRDLYCLAYRPGQRGGDVGDAARRLAELLAAPGALTDAVVPDRRGR